MYRDLKSVLKSLLTKKGFLLGGFEQHKTQKVGGRLKDLEEDGIVAREDKE